MNHRNRGQARGADPVHPTPYTFVPVEVEFDEQTENWYSTSKVYEVPGHSGGLDENRFSGELSVCLRTLTPTLVGARQTEFTPVAEEFRSPLSRPRQLLEPWRLRDGRVVIPGSSLKGMLRHHISALLNAPMEKVADRCYSYRPNLAPGGRGNLKGFPVQLVKRNGEFYARLLNPLSFSEEQNSPDEIELIELRGIDGQGWLDLAFRVAQEEDENSQNEKKRRKPEPKWISERKVKSAREVRVPVEVIQGYCLTQRELADKVNGHLNADHPLNNTEHGKRCIYEASRQLEKAARGNYLRPENILYAEVEFDPKNNRRTKVVSLGHHFRYRWGYRDSVRRLDRRFAESNTRPELAMHYAEFAGDSGDGPASNLTFARALFGYAFDEKIHEPVFEKDFHRLAGRIAINHAIERLDDEASGHDEARFLAKGEMVPLVELGSPKSSAVEFYVLQRIEDNKQGLLTTYGDHLDSPDSFLAGRKFYRHQPPAATDAKFYEAQGDERQNHRALITRYASQPGTEFAFTIRFQDLTREEVGAILLILEIDRSDEYLDIRPKDARKNQPSHALKIGRARPLGWGSVTARVERATLWRAEFDAQNARKEMNGRELQEWEGRLIRGFLASATKHAPNLRRCMAAWEYSGRAVAKYPVKRESADAPEATIFDFHTDLRRRHAKARKNIQNTPVFETERVKPEYGGNNNK